jgi:hypothetical protein
MDKAKNFGDSLHSFFFLKKRQKILKAKNKFNYCFFIIFYLRN